MIVRSPRRRRAVVGLGDGLPSWYSAWTSSGVNDNGAVLAFVQSGQGDPMQVASSTGKAVPYDGGQATQFVSSPWLAMAEPGGGEQVLYLDRPQNYAFVSPGDDVMAAALAKWVLPNLSTPAPAPAVSEAVPVSGGQTAAQAQQVAAINALNAGLIPASSAGTSGQIAVVNAGLIPASSAGTSGQISSVVTPSGLSAIPWWVWVLGIGAIVYFATREN